MLSYISHYGNMHNNIVNPQFDPKDKQTPTFLHPSPKQPWCRNLSPAIGHALQHTDTIPKKQTHAPHHKKFTLLYWIQRFINIFIWPYHIFLSHRNLVCGPCPKPISLRDLLVSFLHDFLPKSFMCYLPHQSHLPLLDHTNIW